MKSISQIAKEQGVSRQYVYARVKEYGLSLDSFTRHKRGRETFFEDEAVKQIVLACQNERVNRVKEGHVNDDMRTRLNKSTEQVCMLKQELEAVRQELKAVKLDLEEKTKELEEAHAKTMEDQQEIARLRSVEEEQRHTISSQAETIRLKTQQELLKLEAREPERVGVFGQIRRLFAGKQKTE